jgi:hypothetical protein
MRNPIPPPLIEQGRCSNNNEYQISYYCHRAIRHWPIENAAEIFIENFDLFFNSYGTLELSKCKINQASQNPTSEVHEFASEKE